MLKYFVCIACSFLTLICIIPTCLVAQNPVDSREDPQLTAIILHRDSLFWQAYNTCEVDAMRNFFTDDIEFYHDKGGVTTGLDAFITATRKGICGSDTIRIRREIIAATVHVFPMRMSGVIYGAILSGDHQFYVKTGSKPEFLDGQAKFTHLWLLKDGAWKMSRVLSYDHGPAHYVNLRAEISLPDTLLKQYTGTYKGPQSGNILIAVDGDHLLLTSEGNKFMIYAETRDRFFMRERDLTFTFTSDAPKGSNRIPGRDKRPLKLVVRENGNIAEELVRQ